MNKDSKIYLAGHRGLVGSAIKNNLESRGYKNIIFCTHAELDLSNQHAVAAFFDKEKPEYVFLAAAKVGGIVANNTYRGEFIYENLMIQNNVIHQSYVHGVKKLLFLGSTCIYPKNCPQPIKEEYLLTSQLEYTNEPYAIAKIAGIKMCESYNMQYGTNFIAVQPTNLYGPNDNFDLEKSHVLPALLRKIHLGKALENNDWDVVRKDLDNLPIEGISGTYSNDEIIAILAKYGIIFKNDKVKVEIWGSGQPRREFLWSEDMADACIHLMENINFKYILEKQFGQEQFTNNDVQWIKQNIEIRNIHINIGTGKDISIKELADTMKTIIGFKGELFFNTDKPDGTLRKLTNTDKLKTLGWVYKVEAQQGIRTMYEWYLKR